MYGGGLPPNMMMMNPSMSNMGMQDPGFGGFNSQFDRVQPVEVPNVQPQNATSIAVTRHICANCGTLRSRKFQAENPLEPGERPPISNCRKCEKEIKSTDDESEVSIELSKGNVLHVSKKQVESKHRVPSPGKRRHKKHHKADKRAETKTTKVEVSKNAAAHLHVCAQCGQPRSKKYQARHPIKKGETPAPSFCGRCQKEETSEEDSDASESENNTQRPASQVTLRPPNESDYVMRRERIIKTEKVSPAHDPLHRQNILLRNWSQVRKMVKDDSSNSSPSSSTSSSDSESEKAAPPPRRRKKKSADVVIQQVYESEHESEIDLSKPLKAEPLRRPKTRKLKKQEVPTLVPIGKYLKNLIFGKDAREKYESSGYGVEIRHHISNIHKDEMSRQKGHTRGRGSYSARYDRGDVDRTWDELSPLIKEEQRQPSPVKVRRARSVDRFEKLMHTRSAGRHEQHSPDERHQSRHGRADYGDFSGSDSEELTREMYKAYLSDGAPIHSPVEQHHHHRSRHEEATVKARGRRSNKADVVFARDESFDSERFRKASEERRMERRRSGGDMGPPPIPHSKGTKVPDAVLQREPDEVIVTTERYVYNKKDGSTSTNSHLEPHSRTTERLDMDSTTSSRRPSTKEMKKERRKSITYEDTSDYYPKDWTPRRRAEKHIRPKEKILIQEIRRGPKVSQRMHSHGPYDDDSLNAVPGSFIDENDEYSEVTPPAIGHRYHHLIGERAPTPSVSTAASTDSWTASYTSSGDSRSRSSKNTSDSKRNVYAPNRGGPPPPREREYYKRESQVVEGHKPGSYVTESELTTSSVRRDRERSDREDGWSTRGRIRSRSPPRDREMRRQMRSSSTHHRPTVHTAENSEDEYDSDADRTLSPPQYRRTEYREKERGKYEEHFEPDGVGIKRGAVTYFSEEERLDPSDLTANDRIRSVSRHRMSTTERESRPGRSRRVSFNEGDNSYHTVSHVSMETDRSKKSTEDVMREMEHVRRLERERDEERREARERAHEDERRERIRMGRDSVKKDDAWGNEESTGWESLPAVERKKERRESREYEYAEAGGGW